EREDVRLPIERLAGKMVRPDNQRLEDTDQPDISVCVIEYKRDRVLALFDIARSGLVEFLKQGRHQLILQEIARPLGESYVLARWGIVGPSEADDPDHGEQGRKPDNALDFHVAHMTSSL